MQNMNIAAVLSGAFGGSAILGLLVFLLFLRKRRGTKRQCAIQVFSQIPIDPRSRPTSPNFRGSSRRMAQAQSEMWRINLVPSPARIILPPPAASRVVQREHDNQAKKARTRSISCSSEGSGYSHLPPGLPAPSEPPSHLKKKSSLRLPGPSFTKRRRSATPSPFVPQSRRVVRRHTYGGLPFVGGLPQSTAPAADSTSAWFGVGDGDRLKSTRLRFRRSSSVGPSVSVHVDDKTMRRASTHAIFSISDGIKS